MPNLKPSRRKRPWLTWMCLASAIVGCSLETLEAGEPARLRVTSMAAGGVEDSPSFVFAAEESTGTIYYAAVDPARPTDFITAGDVTEYLAVKRPTGLAYKGGHLYVVDAGSRRILKARVWGEGPAEVLYSGPPLTKPTSIAVSDAGLVVVADAGFGGLIGISKTGDVKVLTTEASATSASLGFTFRDKLVYLDRRFDGVSSLSGDWFRSPPQRADDRHPGSPEIALEDARNLAAWNGITYVVARHSLYTFSDSVGRLIEATLGHPPPAEITAIAVNDRDLFLADDGGSRIRRISRPVPVDIYLNGSRPENNEALTRIYRYLAEHHLLTTRRVALTKGDSDIWQLLVDNAIFLPVAEPDTRRKADTSRFRIAEVFCSWNEGLCDEKDPASILTAEITGGAELAIPNVAIDSRLRRTRVTLDGRSVADVLELLVPSKAVRERIKREGIVKRLNSKLQRADRGDDLMSLSEGDIVLPEENWILTALVPATDLLLTPDTRLAQLKDEFSSIAVYSQEAYKSESFSMVPTTRPVTTGTGVNHCSLIRSEWQKLKKAIHYPNDYPYIQNATVTIGVLELRDNLVTTHSVFTNDHDRPAWYGVEVVDDPPASPPPANDCEQIHDCQTYNPDNDHGTHVSSLIAARNGPCGSGLLPVSQLVPVDTSSASSIGGDLTDTSFFPVPVYNVSGDIPATDDLKALITSTLQASTFVVAVGNSNKDLNTMIPPAPAAWSDSSNIITVAASTFEPRSLLDGSNFGKKYVDLAAPGYQILGATRPCRYGRASGTSQAAPQVTAAAALLIHQGLTRPLEVRARLIATAEWIPILDNSVWGGVLDFQSAVTFPFKNMVEHFQQPGKLYSIEVTGGSVAVKSGRETYPRSPNPDIRIASKKKIPFDRILSLRRMEENRYRIVYFTEESRSMKILLNAEIDGGSRIKCQTSRWKPGTLDFDDEEETICPQEGLSVTQIKTYFKKSPYGVLLNG